MMMMMIMMMKQNRILKMKRSSEIRYAILKSERIFGNTELHVLKQ